MTAKSSEIMQRWAVIWYSDAKYTEDMERADLMLGSDGSPEMAAELTVKRWFDEGDIEIDDTESAFYLAVRDPKGHVVKIEVLAEQVWAFSGKRLEG